MPKRRSGRRARRTAPPDTAQVDTAQVETWGGEEWRVRRVTGSAATKPYRCPGCDQAIPVATPHVVAWPVEAGLFAASGLEERRHWHTACWRARERRRPPG